MTAAVKVKKRTDILTLILGPGSDDGELDLYQELILVNTVRIKTLLVQYA